MESVKGMEGFNIKHGIFPDLILHHRGLNDKNVVVIEFKGHWSGKGEDDKKLRGFTDQEKNDYHYGLGAFITFETTLENCKILYYKDGKLENEN